MKRLLLVILLLALSVFLVACGGTTEEPAVQEAAPTEEAAVEEIAPTEEPAEPEGTFLERARAGEFAGTEVSVLGTMVEEEAAKMEAAVAPFEEQTGIDVIYQGSKDFETQINNVNIVRIYQKLNFEYARAKYTFHAWLGQAPPPGTEPSPRAGGGASPDNAAGRT